MRLHALFHAPKMIVSPRPDMSPEVTIPRRVDVTCGRMGAAAATGNWGQVGKKQKREATGASQVQSGEG